MSWNTEKRLGFSWVINGVRTSDGKDVYAPAITAMFMDTNVFVLLVTFSDGHRPTPKMRGPSTMTISLRRELHRHRLSTAAQSPSW